MLLSRRREWPSGELKQRCGWLGQPSLEDNLEFAELLAGLLVYGLVFWLALVWVALVSVVLLIPLLILFLYVTSFYFSLYLATIFPGLVGDYWS